MQGMSLSKKKRRRRSVAGRSQNGDSSGSYDTDDETDIARMIRKEGECVLDRVGQNRTYIP